MANWENVGKIQGEKGEKGDRGERGEDGKPRVTYSDISDEEIYYEFDDGTYSQSGSITFSTTINTEVPLGGDSLLYRSGNLEITPPRHENVIYSNVSMVHIPNFNIWVLPWSGASGGSFFVRLFSSQIREDEITLKVGYEYKGLILNE